MVMVSTIIKPIFWLAMLLSCSIAWCCSSSVVGLMNVNLSRSFLYSGNSCFSRVMLNPPSVSMNMTFFPCFAVSIAARRDRLVFPVPAGP